MRDFKGLGIANGVGRIILVQVLVTVAITLLLLIFQNLAVAASAFAGGAVGFLTSLVYAKKMFVPQGAEAKKILRAHQSAEAYKLAFTILLFSFVFTQFKDVHALPLFVTYIATLAVYWAALIFV
ncbi:MAG: ATP synthase protein [Gallionellaceae bacterium]|nr:MAG: ATP synthase protein [Gallionellaceae bacterium]